MATKKELEERVVALEEQLAQPPSIHTLTVTYGADGVISIITSGESTPQSLGLAKMAVMTVLQQLDAMWTMAVQGGQSPPAVKPENVQGSDKVPDLT